jgi:hypothetical protein
MVSLVVLAVYYHQSRRASFFFMREAAEKKTRYTFWVFLALLGVTITLLLSPPQDFPTGRGPVTDSAVALPTATPAVSVLPSPKAPLPPTPTPTRSLPRPERPSPSPTPSPVPTTGPVEGASFSAATLARGITGDKKPSRPTYTFPEGGSPVYLFFYYQGMNKDLRWTQVWLKGTTELFRETTSWEWGEDGTAWVFFTATGGYTAGEYEARLYIEDNLQLSARFRVE